MQQYRVFFNPTQRTILGKKKKTRKNRLFNISKIKLYVSRIPPST